MNPPTRHSSGKSSFCAFSLTQKHLERRDFAFTLVELLVSIVVLILILAVLIRTTSAVSTLWTKSTGRIEQFRNARNGFEAMTRTLGQATLNTYWDYSYNASGVPAGYSRQSDLRFICGPNSSNALKTVVPGYSATPDNILNSESIFFQAPTGVVSGTSGLTPLRELFNTCGYYLNFGSDQSYWPPCLNVAPPRITPKYRFRLMEMIEPSDSLSVYNFTSGTYAASQINSTPQEASTRNWFTIPLNTAAYNHILAENIVALVILPHLANPATSGTLTSNYIYDSTKFVSTPSINSYNQLPPVIQVTMVAIDETSASRLAAASGTAAPNLGLTTLFTNVANYSQDIATLQQILQGKNPSYGLPGQALNYRIFSSDISIPAAKWSTNY